MFVLSKTRIMSYILFESENTEQSSVTVEEYTDPEIEYTIEILPEQNTKARLVLMNTGLMWDLEENGRILHFKNRKRLLRAGHKLVLQGIKIVKTTGL